MPTSIHSCRVARSTPWRVSAYAIPATFEPDRQTAEKVSAVQYVRFPFAGTMRTAIVAGAALTVDVNHPHYDFRQTLPEGTRMSLAAELDGPAAMMTALRQVRDER